MLIQVFPFPIRIRFAQIQIRHRCGEYHGSRLHFERSQTPACTDAMPFRRDALALEKELERPERQARETDVNVMVENESFPAHRFLLTASSPHLRECLNATGGPDVRLTDVSKPSFRFALVYIYSEEVGGAEDVLAILHILEGIHTLRMDDLCRLASSANSACTPASLTPCPFSFYQSGCDSTNSAYSV